MKPTSIVVVALAAGCATPKAGTSPVAPKPALSMATDSPSTPKTPTPGVPTTMKPLSHAKPSAGASAAQGTESKPVLRPPMGASVGMQRYVPKPPTIPPADERVQRKYEIKDQGAVEVLGVCKITEDAVSCWNLDRRPSTDLEARVEDGLNQRQYNSRIRIAYGKKNRLVVARVTRMRSSRTGFNMESLPGVDESINLPMPTGTMMSTVGPWYQYEATIQALDMSAKTTRIRVGLTEQATTQPRLELKPGTRATIDGNTITVRSIRKGEPEQPRFLFSSSHGQSVWTVDVQIRRAKGRALAMFFTLYDLKNGPIMVDKQGNPCRPKSCEERTRNGWRSSGRTLPDGRRTTRSTSRVRFG